MKRFIDLHMHTTFSDGLASPEKVLAMVRERELTAFAVTDHDTIAGYRQMLTLLQDGDPELITGLELSVTYEKQDLHMLAYLFDPDNERLNEALDRFCEHRDHRGRLIVEKLNGMGVDISYDAVEATANGAAIGRPHIAQTMHEHKTVSSYQRAFDQYIGNGKPAYIPKANFSPAEAIDVIHEAGGVAVLAHPQIDETHRHLEMLVGLGLDGIEVRHSAHRQRSIDQFKHFAERFRLVMTGGSDYHGREGRFGAIGSQHVPEEYLVRLKERAKSRKDRL